jgi:hypothetical protein
MLPQSDGFHHRSGEWNHQLAIVGVDDDGGDVEPHGCVLNSWGLTAHGEITDFRNPSLKWPGGTLRVRKKDIEAHLRQDDSWAFSSFEDFPAQVLPEDFFNMF